MQLAVRKVLRNFVHTRARSHQGWSAGGTAAAQGRRGRDNVNNPCADRYVEGLTARFHLSTRQQKHQVDSPAALEALGARSRRRLWQEHIVGLAGEQKHVNALLTTRFASRCDLGRGSGRWQSVDPSFSKRAAPGTPEIVPLCWRAKDTLADRLRSHYGKLG